MNRRTTIVTEEPEAPSASSPAAAEACPSDSAGLDGTVSTDAVSVGRNGIDYESLGFSLHEFEIYMGGAFY